MSGLNESDCWSFGMICPCAIATVAARTWNAEKKKKKKEKTEMKDRDRRKRRNSNHHNWWLRSQLTRWLCHSRREATGKEKAKMDARPWLHLSKS